ncbi:MAG: MoaD/ThiS family protein [Synechococcaceae cyanobacterium]|nr:MoaD/ThiS family protein [Synechococcaceae cyanobacterium]
MRLFAGLREAAGWSEQLVRASGEATPDQIWQQLASGAAWPQSSAIPSGVRVAINQRFAAADTPLADGDELAFLPPISGG